MKRSWPSLRLLVLGPVLTAILVGFVGFAVYLDRVEQGNRIADLDEELVRASLTAVQRPPGGVGGEGNGGSDTSEVAVSGAATSAAGTPVQLFLSRSGGVTLGSAIENPFDQATLDEFIATDLGLGPTVLTDETTNTRVRISTAGRGERQVTALSLDAVDDAVSEFRRALVAGGVLIAALVAGVVWLVTTIVTRPVTRLSETAAIVAGGQLDARTEVHAGAREVTDLASNLDQMVDRLQAALARSELATADAVEAREDMRRLLADVAHELRTPLTALKGYADLYGVGALTTPGDVDRAMTRIGSESERLTALTSEILALARQVPTEEMSTEFDVSSIVAAVADDVRAAQPEHEIQTDLAESLVAVGAPGRVHQVVLNLVTNACLHGESARGVVLRTRHVDGQIEVHVVDHGAGVDPGDADRIFLPLYRAESSRARQAGPTIGAGLGLAVSKQIAEDHGGDLVYAPTPGGGATFTLRLPSVR